MTNGSRERGPQRLLRAAAALAVAALAVAPATALAGGRAPLASPAPGVFGIGPASTVKGTDGRPVTKVDGRPYYFYLAQPGSTLTDLVAVVNVGSAPITLSVYATDAGNSLDGSFAFPAAAVKPVDVGTWIHLRLPHSTPTITVPGRSTTFVPVTVTVPANASPGDHAGALIASLQGEVRNSQGQLVHLDQRVATRIFLRVAGPLHPKLAIEQLAASYHGSLNPFTKGTVTVTYVVHNTGNVKLGGDQVVEVSGLFGKTRLTAVPKVPLLLPGGSVQESVQVSGVLPQVWMTTDVTVTALALPGDVDPAAGPWTASTHFWAVPWALLILVGLILLVLALMAFERRRRSAGQDGRPGGPGDPVEPEPNPVAPTPQGVST